MTDADLDDLLARHPTLFHMAAAGSWPSIRDRGLLSTSALLDLWGWTGPEREEVEARRRPTSVALHHAVLGKAVVRDNAPLNEGKLVRALGGAMPAEAWYRLLNGRVFFWLTEARLDRLLGARLYRDALHDVLEVEARPLVEAHRDRIELSPINSGVTDPFPAPRGPGTFQPIAAYPYAERKAQRLDPVVELVVRGGVEDVARFVRRVTRRRGAAVEAVIWERA